MAGFTSAMSAVDTQALSEDQLDSVRSSRPSRKERRADRRARRSQRTRLTWRTALFVVLVLAVVGGAAATVQWYGTSTYYLSFDDDEVVIFRGRPGGLLWIDPELEERTGIERADVPAVAQDDLEAGDEQPSLARARQRVRNIQRDIDAQDGGATSSTTTTQAN